MTPEKMDSDDGDDIQKLTQRIDNIPNDDKNVIPFLHISN